MRVWEEGKPSVEGLMEANPLQLCQQELGVGEDTQISFSSCLQFPSGGCAWLNSTGRLMKFSLLGHRWERMKSRSIEANRRYQQSRRPWTLPDGQVESKRHGGELSIHQKSWKAGRELHTYGHWAVSVPWVQDHCRLARRVWGCVKELGEHFWAFPGRCESAHRAQPFRPSLFGGTSSYVTHPFYFTSRFWIIKIFQ